MVENEYIPATNITKEHYQKVKNIILSLSRDDEIWRAGNGNFSKWYMNDSPEGGKCRLFDLSNEKDYDWITQRYRTLYWTLNFFDNELKEEVIPISLKNEKGDKLTIGGYETTKAYSLGVDIDKIEDIHKNKKAIEDAARFFVEYLKNIGVQKSVHVAFSGGGIYIYLNHNLFKKNFTTPEETEFHYYLLVNTFNCFIKEIEEKFFEKYPEYKNQVKFDALNNAKRVFKTIFSIHRKHDYAVIPLDRNNIKIEFNEATIPLSDEVIKRGETWYVDFDENEKKPLVDYLTKFQDKIREKYEGKSEYQDIDISKIPIAEEVFPPCIKKILELKELKVGKTRAITLLCVFLGQCGWKSEDAKKLFDTIANNIGASKSNIFESWFKRMHCPRCETIKEKGSGFPSLNMGELDICQEDDFCKKISSPYEYTCFKGNILEKKPTEVEREKEWNFIKILPESHFISKFISSGEDTSDAYPEYHFTDALSALSTAIGRDAVVKLTPAEFRLNLWIINVGYSTISRKSTAMDNVKNILSMSDLHNIILPHDFTPESLVSELAQKPYCLFIHSEIGNFLAGLGKKYQSGMLDFLCYIYDSPLEYKRKLRKEEFIIRKPYVNILGATTPDTLSRYSSDIFITSGFFNRINFVFPERKKERKRIRRLTTEDDKKRIELGSWLEDIFSFSADCSKFGGVEFELSDETLEHYNIWCEDVERYIMNTVEGKEIAGYFGRLQKDVIKISCLIEVGKPLYRDKINKINKINKLTKLTKFTRDMNRDNTNPIVNLLTSEFCEFCELLKVKVSLDSLKVAIFYSQNLLIPSWRKVANLVNSASGAEKIEKVFKLAVRYLEDGKISHSDLIRHVHMTSKDFREVIDTLVESERFIRTEVDTGSAKNAVFYTPCNFKTSSLPSVEIPVFTINTEDETDNDKIDKFILRYDENVKPDDIVIETQKKPKQKVEISSDIRSDEEVFSFLREHTIVTGRDFTQFYWKAPFIWVRELIEKQILTGDDPYDVNIDKISTKEALK